VRVVVGKVALRQVLPEFLGFNLSISFMGSIRNNNRPTGGHSSEIHSHLHRHQQLDLLLLLLLLNSDLILNRYRSQGMMRGG
jgi:hypothetical protein